VAPLQKKYSFTAHKIHMSKVVNCTVGTYVGL
jgi:hypothetical protein